MTNDEFILVWLLSFFLYLVIYTWWIPHRTQVHIEKWLRSEDSDETLILSLQVIIKAIREQALVDFEEFMLPRARESFKNFWSGAMGNVAKEIGKTEEGSNLHMLSNMAKSLENESWYVQAMASKLLPILQKSAEKGGATKTGQGMGLGLGKNAP
jgi:hypothetical protein